LFHIYSNKTVRTKEKKTKPRTTNKKVYTITNCSK